MMAAVRDLFQTCTPRADVLSGELPDSVFAANLAVVVAEDPDAPDTYRDAETFFEVTHPSKGLGNLLDEALGRICGSKSGAAPVIRLETNLGGGKTHNLIALWHAAKGRLDPVRATAFMDPANLPSSPVERVAVFVGTETGATSFPERDGVTPTSPWGHIALQLGGSDACAKVDGPTAPGAGDFREILGDEPALILIDELARYLTVAAGHAVEDSNLARQTVAFLMSLMEAVDGSPHAALVITTTAVTDAFGDHTEDILQAMTEAASLLSRKEHVLRPAEEADLPKILARRLFAEVDSTHATKVGKAYAEAATEAYGRGADLPEDLTGVAWAQTVADTWPFHPSLIEVLDKRLSTIPNFNRTRGALRLLADTVRMLWVEQPKKTLAIHTHHVDLSDPRTVEELTSRLGRGNFEPVVRADVAGAMASPSHADEVDKKLGKPFARRLATTAYLWSLTEQVPGVASPELLGSVLAPGDDHNVIARSLDQLEQACWYLHADDRGWRFSTEASLVKLVQEAQAQIATGRVRDAATDILGRQFKEAALKVRRSWEDGRVPDREEEAALVLLHWDDFGDAHGVDPAGPVPDRITETWEKTPAGGLRQYRNRLVFLAPSAGSHEPMLDAVRRHLALKALEADSETVKALTAEKRQELKQRSKESELLARVGVCNHVDVLYVPQRDGLEATVLTPVTTASVPPNQTDAIVERLAAMDKTLAAGDPPLDPALVKSRLGVFLDQALSTADLARQFARRSDLKLVLDRAQLTNLVRNGVTNGVWEYHDTTRSDEGWATKERPSTYRIADDCELHPIGAAPEPTRPPCPMCGETHEGACDGTTPPAPVPKGDFEAEGSASKAVADVIHAARDAAAGAIEKIVISIDDHGDGLQSQLARLHSVITASSGADLVYDVSVIAGLGTPGHSVRVEFTGTPENWSQLKTAVDQVLKNNQATVQATVTATWQPPLPIDHEAIDAITQRANDTGPGRCHIAMTAGSPS